MKENHNTGSKQNERGYVERDQKKITEITENCYGFIPGLSRKITSANQEITYEEVVKANHAEGKDVILVSHYSLLKNCIQQMPR